MLVCVNFRSGFYCFDLFSAKYRKGNVSFGVPNSDGYYVRSSYSILFCLVERELRMSLYDDTQADIIESCKSTFRYLDDRLNIKKHYFKGIDTQNSSY